MPTPLRRIAPWLVVIVASVFIPAFACATEPGRSGSAERRGQPAAGERRPDLAGVEERVVKATNDFRAEQNLRRLEVNSQLRDAAEGFARYMARTGRYGHEADGRQPAERVKAAGYDYCIAAENIAYSYNSAGFRTEELADGFFTGWKNSPEHRENMLDPDVYETAVAVARSPETGYYYAVQLFGRPKSRQVAFQIANESGAEVRYALGGKEFTLGPRYTRTHYACRPPTVEWKSDGKGPGGALKPEGGTKYVVVEGDDGTGKPVIRREADVEIPAPKADEPRR